MGNLIGGSGNDELIAEESGTTALLGYEGNDRLIGNDNFNMIDGGSGDDYIDGRGGNDSINGDGGTYVVDKSLNGPYPYTANRISNGNDVIYGGAGNDLIDPGRGNDFADGGDGNDFIRFGSDDDVGYGGAGEDVLSGHAGNDYLDGSSDNDILSGGSGANTLIGGDGFDTVIYNVNSERVSDVRFENGKVIITTDFSVDTISQVESFEFLDRTYTLDEMPSFFSLRPVPDPALKIEGTSLSETLYGMNGNDWFYGGAGDDEFYGFLGIDTVKYNHSVLDITDINAYGYTITGPEGTDTLNGIEILEFKDLILPIDSIYDATENVGMIFYGTDEVDFVKAGGGGDVIYTGAADDIIIQAQHNDYIDGGAGNDIVSLNFNFLGSNTTYKADGTQVITGQSGSLTHSVTLVNVEQVMFLDQTAPLEISTFQPIQIKYTFYDEFNNETQQLAEQYIGTDISLEYQYIGTSNKEILEASYKNDFLNVAGGDDTVLAGAGDDLILGGDGIDSILGGLGNDQIYGENGDDNLFGDEGNDSIYGGDGDDLIDGNTGDDHIEGGNGNDEIVGSEGDDFILGEDGDDVIVGGLGNDQINGGNDNDIIAGGLGDDVVDGGAGEDVAVFNINSDEIIGLTVEGQTVTISSPEGNDSYQNIETYVFNNANFSLDELKAQSDNLPAAIVSPSFSVITQDGSIQLITAEKYEGAVEFLEYQLLGDADGNIVTGSSGNDFINLLGGDDAANGGDGQDVLDGGAGSNFLTGGNGADTFFLDGRGGDTTWSTITDFNGDTVNIWGWIDGVSRLVLSEENAGASGFVGATFHYDLNGNGLIDTSITFSGLSMNNAPNSSAQVVAENGYLLFV